eukprot:CAMPEP_0172415148 /NCGR_PEP_ID=MMETSP1064-20121228/1647_1 /TAXON_ID=202472 /ORGANISM="Aulacoseira subarctica , Strain CCAP 1002/5" /LENGTH=362 /DNA_ID=CAMNT_0013152053 /DNA_START=79 /DNA_END=1167 /DNA_ORIENTATION=-
MSASKTTTARYSLYDVPVSNHGARCRIIVYKKQLPSSEVSIVSPAELGGLKSPEYLALNRQGKMPLLSENAGGGLCIPESDTICRYLMSEYESFGPSFLPNNPRSNLIARIHDIYISPIQGCMYKPSPPFGAFYNRKNALAELQRQLSVIDELIDDNGPYVLGDEISYGDAALFPTMIFVKFMLPKFGVSQALLPSKIQKWFDRVIEVDSVFSKVNEEVLESLKKWDEAGRWNSIWLAGANKDYNADTIFDKIIAGQIPSTKVLETEDVLCFKDINPVAPAHVLVIPKDRNGLCNIRKSSPEHVDILGKLLVAAGVVAKDTSLGFGSGGARIVINDGEDAGQEVPHLHLHVIGGRQMTWPPG